MNFDLNGIKHLAKAFGVAAFGALTAASLGEGGTGASLSGLLEGGHHWKAIMAGAIIAGLAAVVKLLKTDTADDTTSDGS